MYLKYIFEPLGMTAPSSFIGPLRSCTFPISISVSVTPGAGARLTQPTAKRPIIIRVPITLFIIIPPPFYYYVKRCLGLKGNNFQYMRIFSHIPYNPIGWNIINKNIISPKMSD